MEIKRIMGKDGRTTVPFAIRNMMQLKQNDVIVFEYNRDSEEVTISKAVLCDGCCGLNDKISESEAIALVDMLPDDIQKCLLEYLFRKVASLPIVRGNANESSFCRTA